MSKAYTCIIPARYKSSRFPGKPLEPILGKPMILWVIERANEAERVSRAVVATDDKRIYDVVTKAGYEAMYTSEDCPNGSERVAEVAAKLDDEWIFEMQGDQPLVTARIIDDFINRAEAAVTNDNRIDVVIPYAEATDEQTASPDVLKVVVTASEKLTFQTRQPIQTGYRTLGLYLWNREALLRYAKLPVSRIEKAEDSHPIRLYVNDFVVQGLKIEETDWVEVDRDFQIEQVEELLKRQNSDN